MLVLCMYSQEEKSFTRSATQCRTGGTWPSYLKGRRANPSFNQPRISFSTGHLRQPESSTQAPILTKDAIKLDEPCHSDFSSSSRGFYRPTKGDWEGCIEEAFRKNELKKGAAGRGLLRTPSRRLIDALRSFGAKALIPRRPKGKVDLSFFNVREYDENLGKSLPH